LAKYLKRTWSRWTKFKEMVSLSIGNKTVEASVAEAGTDIV